MSVLEDQAAAVLRYARDLPEGTVLPVQREVLLSLVAPQSAPAAVIPPAALTVEQIAARFNRGASTVRQWFERGLFPGAFKFRAREWRSPLAGVLAFEKREQEQGRRQRRTGLALRLVRDSSHQPKAG